MKFVLAVLTGLLLASASAALAQVAPRPAPGSFRVLQWNVSDSAWVRHADATRAVLRHADADVIILDEVNEHLGMGPVLDVLRGLRGASDTTWFVSIGAGGGFQRTVIASRDTVAPLPEFALVSLPADGALAARAAMPDTVQGRARRDAVSTAAVNGVLVRIHGRRLLVVGMDLACCGSPGGWRDARRVLEASAIAGALRAAAARTAPAGVVTAGDMNLVTGRVPLDTVLAAVAAARYRPMQVAEAVHPDGWSTWTWDGRGTPFSAGRLDVMTYSAGTLRQLRGAVWNTEMMSADTLRAHGLEAGTSASINRHRPVVVDFAWRS